MKPERVCELPVRFQPPNLSLLTSLASKLFKAPFYSPSSSPLLRLIILFLLKDL
jgi:hypothetical protein